MGIYDYFMTWLLHVNLYITLVRDGMICFWQFFINLHTFKYNTRTGHTFIYVYI